MLICREVHDAGWEEHDFFFTTPEAASVAAQALTAEGFRVGGGNDPNLRATIDLGSRSGHKIDIDAARQVIESLPEITPAATGNK